MVLRVHPGILLMKKAVLSSDPGRWVPTALLFKVWVFLKKEEEEREEEDGGG